MFNWLRRLTAASTKADEPAPVSEPYGQATPTDAVEEDSAGTPEDDDQHSS